jgi:hypothetical protein
MVEWQGEQEGSVSSGCGYCMFWWQEEQERPKGPWTEPARESGVTTKFSGFSTPENMAGSE